MPVTVTKITIAIGKEEYAWARARARRDRTSVSAVLTEAARRMREDEVRSRRQRAAWERLERWLTGGKGFSPQELEAAQRELDGETHAERPAPSPRKRRSRRAA